MVQGSPPCFEEQAVSGIRLPVMTYASWQKADDGGTEKRLSTIGLSPNVICRRNQRARGNAIYQF
jgi:hypothetical protein